jgi:hypothetical protein
MKERFHSWSRGAPVEPDAFPSEERGEVRKALEGFWAFDGRP